MDADTALRKSAAELYAQNVTKSLSNRDFGRKIRFELPPPWQSAAGALRAAPLAAASKLAPLQTARGTYTNERGEALELLAGGAKSNDSREIADAQPHLKSAEAALTTVSELLKKLY